MVDLKEMVLTVPISTSVLTVPIIARQMDLVQIHSAALNALVTQDSATIELTLPTSMSVLPVLTVALMLIASTQKANLAAPAKNFFQKASFDTPEA